MHSSSGRTLARYARRSGDDASWREPHHDRRRARRLSAHRWRRRPCAAGIMPFSWLRSPAEPACTAHQRPLRLLCVWCLGLPGLAAATKPKPTVRAPRWDNTRSNKLSQEKASSGKSLMQDHVFSTRCTFCSLPPRRSFRESGRAPFSGDGLEHHCRSQLERQKHQPTSD